jgi:hypothetical protein
MIFTRGRSRTRRCNRHDPKTSHSKADLSNDRLHVLRSWRAAVYDGNGRGGIRTHGGFPHARFRVECLKPDSATLPKGQKNAERPTSNIQRRMQTSLRERVRAAGNPVLRRWASWPFLLGSSLLVAVTWGLLWEEVDILFAG